MIKTEMTEKQLQKEVLRLMRQNGWRAAHFGNSVKLVNHKGAVRAVPDPDARGFPDIVAIRDGRLLVAELKSYVGRPTEHQSNWLSLFQTVTKDVFLWTPKDWPDKIYKVVKR